MPLVKYTDASMSAPLSYDDVGDTAAWTGTLLAALAHTFAVQEARNRLSVHPSTP